MLTTPAMLSDMKNDFEVATWLSSYPIILELAVKMHQAKQTCTFNTSENISSSLVAPTTPSIGLSIMQAPLTAQGNSLVSYFLFIHRLVLLNIC